MSWDLLITFALPEETSSVRKRLGISAACQVGHVTSARVGNLTIGLLPTGMGKRRAGEALDRILREQTAGCVVSSGFAGGLQSGQQAGDLIVPPVETAQSPAWREELIAELKKSGTVRCGLLHTADVALESAEDKARLALESGAAAVDMETAALQASAARHGVPFFCVRALSDLLEEDLPVPLGIWFDETKQRPRPLRLVTWLAVRPMACAAFMRFLGSVASAGQALGLTAKTLCRVVETQRP